MSYTEMVECPFTGKQLELKKVGDNHWMGVGEFYSTRLFPTKRHLLFWLLHREGFAPDFNVATVEYVRERVPPPREAPETTLTQQDADEVFEQAKESVGLK